MDISSVPSALMGLSQFGSSPTLVPGQVVEAVVLALLEDGSVRLALPDSTLDVRSSVPLTVGTPLQLVVKSTQAGLQLVVSSDGSSTTRGSAAPVGTAAPSQTPSTVAPTSEAAPQATAVENPAAKISIPGASPTSPSTPARPSPPAEDRPVASQAGGSEVIANAVRIAAARQGGLAPLMADVDQLMGANTTEVPAAVLKAAAQLLALRLPLEDGVTAADIKQALSQSGLFLEARLAPPASEDVEGAGVAADPPGTATAPANPAAASTATLWRASASTTPSTSPELALPIADLKAALLVLRQVVSLWANETGPAPKASTATADTMDLTPVAADEAAGEQLPQSVASDAPLTPTLSLPPSWLAPPSSPSSPLLLSSSLALPSSPASLPLRSSPSLLPPSSLPLPPSPSSQPPSLPSSPPSSAATPSSSGMPSSSSPPSSSLPLLPPPPPYRGSPLVAQPAAAAALAPGSDPADTAQRLLGETEAALARHTLFQAASLPDRPGADAPHVQTQGPQWTFEVPMMTSAGTSIAQFEIGREGRAVTEDGRAIWRARFSVDIEPMGPVHAQVALLGNRAAVTLWAERPQSAARLHENSALLAEALEQAELEPGDILCRTGTPAVPRTSVPAAGRFLDRAS